MDIITGAAIDNIGTNDPFVIGFLKFVHRCFQLFLGVILLGILQGAKGWFVTRPTGEATANAPEPRRRGHGYFVQVDTSGALEPRRRVPMDADAQNRGEM